MQTKVKNRGWVKDVALVFLTILLLLTFFSNTINNRNLPEVATEYASSGTISAKIRGTGTVTANGSYQVKMTQTREIRSVMIKEGQEINAGDVLFILGNGESSEIEEAEETLRQLQLNYKSTALGMPSYDSSLDDYHMEQMEARLEAAESAVEAAQEQLDNYLEEKKGKDYKKRKKAALSAMEAAAAVCDEKAEALAEIEAEYEESVTLAENALLNAMEELTRVKATEADIGEEYTQEMYDTALAAANKAVADATTYLNAEKSARDIEVGNAKEDLAEAQAAYEAAAAAYAEYENAGGEYKQRRDEAQAAYDAVYDEYLELKYSIDQQKESIYKSAAQVGIQLQDINEQIEKAKARLEELTGGTENQITANVSGIVDSIAFTAGDTVSKDEVLCTLTVPDMGYSLSFSVTNDQAKRVHVGDSATISNYYWGSQITATLSGMKPDPKNPQTNKVLTFDLSGDVTVGSELTVSVGSKSATYDYVIPNSAKRSDANGDYVLIIESKSSALGNRYFAKRVNVEILASDDTYSAIYGELGYGEYVITASTNGVPIEDGQQVRIAGA